MKIFKLECIDSTNAEAKRLLQDNIELPFVVIANEQIAGKGQGDHSWNAAKGLNITCSFALEVDIPSEYQYLITVATSLSIVSLLKNFIAEDRIKIKWPNDIYIDDNKICGILITNKVFCDNIASTIIGIGLNINQIKFPINIPNPTSLKIITNKDCDIDVIFKDLCDNIIQHFEKIIYDKENLTEEYTKHLYKLGKYYEYSINGQLHKGIVKGINEIGELVIL